MNNFESRKEIWKDIPGYENLYQVSNNGRIKSIGHYTRNNINGGTRLTKGIVLSPYIMPNGYYQVQLSKKGKKEKHYVHRLVALAFLNNEKNMSDVNHIDGNKSNNFVENLEWCSHRDNQIHMVKSRMTKKACPVLCLETREIYNSMSEAERETNIDRHSIKKSCESEKSYRGYHWRFVK